MSDATEFHRRAIDGFDARVSAVDDPAAWDAPSPCEGWTAREVLAHVVHNQRVAAMRLRGADADTIEETMEGVDVLADGPLESWRSARDDLLAAAAEEGALDQIVSLPFGDMPARDALRIISSDTLLHTWDLAIAVGGDTNLPADLCEENLARTEPADELLRAPGLLGPKIEPPDGADAQTRMLCFFGRQP